MSIIKGDWAQGNACEILFRPTIKIGDYTVELYNHSDYDKISPLIELPFNGYYIDALLNINHLFDLVDNYWCEQLSCIEIKLFEFIDISTIKEIGILEEVEQLKIAKDNMSLLNISLFKIRYDEHHTSQEIVKEIINKLISKDFDVDFYKNPLIKKLFDKWVLFYGKYMYNYIKITFHLN